MFCLRHNSWLFVADPGLFLNAEGGTHGSNLVANLMVQDLEACVYALLNRCLLFPGALLLSLTMRSYFIPVRAVGVGVSIIHALTSAQLLVLKFYTRISNAYVHDVALHCTAVFPRFWHNMLSVTVDGSSV